MNALQLIKDVTAAAEPTQGLKVLIDHPTDPRGSYVVLLPDVQQTEWDENSTGQLFRAPASYFKPVNAKLPGYTVLSTSYGTAAHDLEYGVEIIGKVVAGKRPTEKDGFTRFWKPEEVPADAMLSGGGVLVRTDERKIPMVFSAFKMLNAEAGVKALRYHHETIVVSKTFKPSSSKTLSLEEGTSRRVVPAQQSAEAAAKSILDFLSRVQIKRVLPAFKILD